MYITMYKQMLKNLYIGFHSKMPHTITKMNDNKDMDSTIAGSMNAHMSTWSNHPTAK